MADLFKEIIPSIMLTKEHVLENQSDYVPFIVNKALSFHFDCLFYANQANLNAQLDKPLQYLLLLNTIRAKKRSFVPWAKKPVASEAFAAVKRFFEYSDQKTQEVFDTLTEEQVNLIIEQAKEGE